MVSPLTVVAVAVALLLVTFKLVPAALFVVVLTVWAKVVAPAILPAPVIPPLLLLKPPLMEAPPAVTLKAPLKLRPAKAGVAALLIPCTVLIVPVPLSVKLVALKVAIPLVEASALALLIVMVPALPLLLLKDRTPVWVSRLVTPPPAPPVQLPQLGAVLAPPEIRQEPVATSAKRAKALVVLAYSKSPMA